MNRRSFLAHCAGLAGLASLPAAAQQQEERERVPLGLKAAAHNSNKILGMYVVGHDLEHDAMGANLIAREFSLIADGNDLKFSDRLRPTPDTYNYAPGEYSVDWAHNKGLLFRGHALVWHNALPKWFQSYVNKDNAKQVMTDHITNVVRHFAGRVYSWDVVNEPIHNDRPDGLRVKPWLDLMGPEYIDIAFHTASEADPKAKLVINECFIEHDVPNEAQRRDALLHLVSRLKKQNVPLTTVGIQGHIKAEHPLATDGLRRFMESVRDLGLEIMITELDVDDTGIPADQIDDIVARKYAEFLELVNPYVTVVTFEQLYDNPNLPKRPDGITHRPNLFDGHYQPKPAYNAAINALRGSRRGGVTPARS